MIKIVIGIALAAVAVAVYFLGQMALVAVVGIGIGVAFGELIDLGTKLEANKRIIVGDDDDEPRGRR